MTLSGLPTPTLISYLRRAKDSREYRSRCEESEFQHTQRRRDVSRPLRSSLRRTITFSKWEVNCSEITDGFCVRVSESQRTRDNAAELRRLDNDNTITPWLRATCVLRLWRDITRSRLPARTDRIISETSHPVYPEKDLRFIRDKCVCELIVIFWEIDFISHT